MRRPSIKFLIRMLGLANGCLLAAIPVTGVALWMTYPQAPDLSAEPVAVTTLPATTTERHELAWYAPLWERDLRQPPIPPVEQPKAAAIQPSQPPPVLLATLVGPEGRWAHFREADGRVRMRTVEDAVGGFTVKAIEPGRVQLLQGNDEFWVWLEVPKKAEP